MTIQATQASLTAISGAMAKLRDNAQTLAAAAWAPSEADAGSSPHLQVPPVAKGASSHTEYRYQTMPSLAFDVMTEVMVDNLELEIEVAANMKALETALNITHSLLDIGAPHIDLKA